MIHVLVFMQYNVPFQKQATGTATLRVKSVEPEMFRSRRASPEPANVEGGLQLKAHIPPPTPGDELGLGF